MTDIGGRAWELVLRTIEADLLSGSLKPGDHLPPERTLAAELQVGRSSVREALRVLEALGLIRTQTGSGPGAGAIITAAPSGGLGTLMRLQVAATGFAVADIVKTRVLLETAVARELANAAPVPDLQASATLLDAMDELGLTPEEFLALDAAFHVSLADASGNQVVAAIMSGLRTSIEGYVQAGVPSLPSWDATAEQLRGEHRAILRAVTGGDPDVAAARINSHITGYYTATSLPLHERN
ncbi:MAG TPA: FCD domain-containing protein [Glaciibacter sp.]|nr:FCD domain-containing protein [Glaciibacter sp.]